MCLDEDDIQDVAPLLDAYHCKDFTQGVQYALKGHNVVMSMTDQDIEGYIPLNVPLTVSWALFLEATGMGVTKPEYLQ